MRGAALIGALVIASSCGGGKANGKSAESVESREAHAPARRHLLDLEFIELARPRRGQQAWLVSVDEMGARARTKLREYPASCVRVALGRGDVSIPGELLAAECRDDEGGGFDVRIVLRQGELVYLEARLMASGNGRQFDERGRFPVPAGAAIEATDLELE